MARSPLKVYEEISSRLPSRPVPPSPQGPTRKLDPSLKQRADTFNELLTTELSYLRDLSVIIGVRSHSLFLSLSFQ